MKVCIFTDNHFSQNSSIIRSNGERFSTRLENQIESLNWVEQLALDNNCSQVICLGDFFDSSSITAQELTALKEIKWNNLPHYFLVGNHETASSNLDFNSVNVLAKIGKVINKPYYETGFGYRFIYLPYILESERQSLKKYLKDLVEVPGMWETCEYKQTFIFSHNDIAGIRYGQYESKIGFNLEEITNNCTMYINGHLHNQQQINERVLNLGNLTGQNFSEDGFKYTHNIAILDTDTMKVDLIPNPYAFYFYKLEINTLEELRDITKELSNKSIVSIKCPTKIITEVRQYLNNCNNIKEYRVIGIPDLNEEIVEQCELTKMDHIDQFKQYIINEMTWSEALEEELANI